MALSVVAISARNGEISKNQAIATMTTSATAEMHKTHLAAHCACTSTSVSGSALAGALFDDGGSERESLDLELRSGRLSGLVGRCELDISERRNKLQADDQAGTRLRSCRSAPDCYLGVAWRRLSAVRGSARRGRIGSGEIKTLEPGVVGHDKAYGVEHVGQERPGGVDPLDDSLDVLASGLPAFRTAAALGPAARARRSAIWRSASSCL